MGAAVVLNHGTEEMHQKHLKKIFTGEDIWCQLFLNRRTDQMSPVYLAKLFATAMSG